jgi:D-lactate dehydrogenase (cytochrome)
LRSSAPISMNYTTGSRISKPGGSCMREIRKREEVADAAADLLIDESSLSGGWCSEAVWPETEEEAALCVKDFVSRDVQVTPSGALTGVAGGAVPEGGAVISTAALKGVSDAGAGRVRVLAGTTLEELDSWLGREKRGWFYPPDPTEKTASIGGTIATDASGSDSFLYGSTRTWIDSLRIVLPGGAVLDLDRGGYRFGPDGRCTHPALGTLELPVLRREPPPKNAAGYWLRPGMDLLDLFVGSEGTLGLVTSAVLRLSEVPAHVVDIAVFIGDGEAFWKLFEEVRGCGLRLRALEMMDDRCLGFLARHHRGDGWVLLTRFEAPDDEGLDLLLETVESMVEEAGVPPDGVWGGFEPRERQRITDFRHALPETVNSVIAGYRESCPGIHKLGTDSAVPPRHLREFHGVISRVFSATGLEFLVFGHAGQGHLHANVLPPDLDGERKGEEALMEVSRWAVGSGGTISAEHGIGRLKAGLLGLMYSDGELAGMRAIRRAVDPGGLFSPAVGWP